MSVFLLFKRLFCLVYAFEGTFNVFDFFFYFRDWFLQVFEPLQQVLVWDLDLHLSKDNQIEIVSHLTVFHHGFACSQRQNSHAIDQVNQRIIRHIPLFKEWYLLHRFQQLVQLIFLPLLLRFLQHVVHQHKRITTLPELDTCHVNPMKHSLQRRLRYYLAFFWALYFRNFLLRRFFLEHI